MFFIFLVSFNLFAGQTGTVSGSKSQANNLENSYQIDQQKKAKPNYRIGVFHDSRTGRNFKAKYKIISSDKTKVTLVPVKSSSFSSSSVPTSRSSYSRPTPVKKKKAPMGKTELEKILKSVLKKKK